MGQFSPTVRLTSTHPTTAFGPWQPLNPTATLITMTFENQTLDAGGNAAVFCRLFWSASPTGSSPTLVGSTTATFSALTAPVSFPFSTAGIPSGSYVSGTVTSNTPGNTNSIDLTYFDNLTYCAYGTEPNPSATVYTLVTEALVDAIAGLLGLGAVGIIALDTLIGAPLVFPTCGNPPPLAPTFTSDDFLLGTGIPSPSGLVKLPRLLATGLWFFFCQCTAAPPGSPAAQPFPPLGYTGQPVGPVAQPVPTCNPEDLCTELNKITNQLNALSLQLGYVRQDVTLIQRQHVPFAYVPGTLHSALSGEGTISIQAILGLVVQITTDPGNLSRDTGLPPSTYRWGTISWGTVDGWQVRHWVTHNPHLFVGIGAEATLVGYTFADGVVANLLELVREP